MQTKKTPATGEYYPGHHPVSTGPKSRANLWIVVLSLCFLSFLVWSKFDSIKEYFGGASLSGAIQNGFSLGDAISLEGVIAPNGDFVTHTHTLTTQSSGIFGLKSKTINLNQYTGVITVDGRVSDQREGLTIVDVLSVIAQADSGVLAATGIVATGTIDPVGVYIPQLGVYFAPGFTDEYTLVNSGKNGVLSIKHLTNNQMISLEYFTCKASNPNENCTQLQETFASTNDTSFSTNNGDTFTKLEGANSWFFHNGNLFGYFINNVSEQEVIALTKFLILPTQQYVKDFIEPTVSSLCVDGNVHLEKITRSSLILEKQKLIAKFAGTWASGTVDCSLSVNPSLALFAEKKSMTFTTSAAPSVDVTSNTNTTSSSSSSVSSLSTNGVKQFPITLDKTMEFTSRGHTVVFPSKKISFSSSNVRISLDVKGLSCTVQTKVIDYANKVNLETTPAVSVYECSVKAGTQLPSNYVQIPYTDGKVFLVEVIDSAWVDFANNIQVR